MKKLIPSLFFLLLILSGCQESFYFSETNEFNKGGWAYQDSLDFKVNILDTTTHFDLVLDLEHDVEYSYQNIYLYINTLFPSGERFGRQVNIDLADKLGQWQGKCSSKSCQVRVDLQSNAYFNKIGEYVFTIKQFMRMDTLAGIQSMSFRLREKPMEAK